MVISQQVKDPMDQQEGQFGPERDPSFLGLAGGLGKAYHHIPQGQGTPWDPRHLPALQQRKGKNVGRLVLAPVVPVQFFHLRVADPGHRKFDASGKSRAFHPAQDPSRQPEDPGP